MNGEQVTKIILDRLLKIEEKLDDMDEKIDRINSYGCAHRANDLDRISKVERSVGALFYTLLVALGAIVMQFFGLHLGK
jgi:tetrahydromethanopterin S-methyltransferase subunit G